ncbi:hypothetical protein AVEN_133317-1 [Araneus ventricosus]|uniref:Uncharacterized protein n=1 Tax=Araneus ventricosus TaxID=182803 RepID=A0A4Y2DJR5_ARAVE|nr:hypothetical protein AVEN_133317-1 [Araneus ventricosus]
MEKTIYVNKLTEVAAYSPSARVSSGDQISSSHNVSQLECNHKDQMKSHSSLRASNTRLPSILICHSDPNSQEGVSSLLVDALPAPKAKISDIKQTRSKGLLVTFRSDKEKSFQREIAELDHIKDKIILSEPSKRNPSVIIYNIPKSITESSIQQGLRQISLKTSR